MKRLGYQEHDHIASFLADHFGNPPETCVITGSAGVNFEASKIPLTFKSVIPFLNQGTKIIEGHKGTVDVVSVNGKSVCYVNGRLHFFQGFTPSQVVFLPRVLAIWGCKNFILTNASGALAEGFTIGTLVNITDHISSEIATLNPMIGEADRDLGRRFTSMQNAYSLSPVIQDAMKACSEETRLNNMKKSGVYTAVPGPTFETEAECKKLRNDGADIVGMSTIPEIIALKAMDSVGYGLRMGAISMVTNYCLNITSDYATTYGDNHYETAQKHSKGFTNLMTKVISML